MEKETSIASVACLNQDVVNYVDQIEGVLKQLRGGTSTWTNDIHRDERPIIRKLWKDRNDIIEKHKQFNNISLVFSEKDLRTFADLKNMVYVPF